MDSPIIRGSEVELKAQRARHIAYRKWARRISTDIDRREQQRIEDELNAADQLPGDTLEQHQAWEGRMENFV